MVAALFIAHKDHLQTDCLFLPRDGETQFSTTTFRVLEGAVDEGMVDLLLVNAGK